MLPHRARVRWRRSGRSRRGPAPRAADLAAAHRVLAGRHRDLAVPGGPVPARRLGLLAGPRARRVVVADRHAALQALSFGVPVGAPAPRAARPAVAAGHRVPAGRQRAGEGRARWRGHRRRAAVPAAGRVRRAARRGRHRRDDVQRPRVRGPAGAAGAGAARDRARHRDARPGGERGGRPRSCSSRWRPRARPRSRSTARCGGSGGCPARAQPRARARADRCGTCPRGCCASATRSWPRSAPAGSGRCWRRSAAGRSTTPRCWRRWPRSARRRGPCSSCSPSAAPQVLAQIPITPGGLGFVEAGLTATLALAGVGAGNAVLATFAYRLFNYWLPLPAGLAAYVVHRRRRDRETAAAAA